MPSWQASSCWWSCPTGRAGPSLTDIFAVNDPYFRFIWSLTNLVGEGTNLPGGVPEITFIKPKAGDTLIVNQHQIIRVEHGLFDPSTGKALRYDQLKGKVFSAGTQFCVTGPQSYDLPDARYTTTVYGLQYIDPSTRHVVTGYGNRNQRHLHTQSLTRLACLPCKRK